MFEYLKDIDLEVIFLRCLEHPDFSSNKESSVQRIIRKIIRDDSRFEYFHKDNILSNIRFLEIVHKKIYERYHHKVSEEPKDISLIETIFERIEIKEYFRFDENWTYDSYSGTIRKFGEKLLPSPGKFVFYNNKNNDLNNKREVKLLIETSKRVAEYSENETDDNHYWIIGNNFQTEGFSNRFYFNISPTLENFEQFLTDISNWLNERSIPFKMKFPKSLENFKTRLDNTVLYIPRENTLLVFEVLKRISNKYQDSNLFDLEIPMFTRKVFKGVSFGENPDNRAFTSFGSYRSAILSILLVDSFLYKKLICNKFFEFNTREFEIKIEKLQLFKDNAQKYAGLGKDWIKRFYTNQYSTYNYDYHFNYFDRYYPEENSQIENDSFLFGAYKVASIVWNEAFFYPDIQQGRLLSNWLHCESDIKDKKGSLGFEYVSLSSTFETGIPGIVFFLMNFQKLYPTKFNYTVSYAAIISFVKSKSNHLQKYQFFTLFPHFKSNQLFDNYRNSNNIQPINLSLSRFTDSNSKFILIDKVVFSDFLLNNEEKLLAKNILSDIKNGVPFNNFNNNTEPNLSLGYGYALLGYFFLRLHNPILFAKLRSSFEIISEGSSNTSNEPAS